MTDYAHTDHAAKGRADKARRLAAYAWHRGITGADLRSLPPATRRKLARSAATNPPGTDETWHLVAELLDEKDAWAARHPNHPAAQRHNLDEKILWVKPPVKPWGERRTDSE
ncbi:hypothetical protein NDR87_32735 [Nocardia sp. CDC159]|uniref:Uncharacterized protein n=1 Tax=Nocardia pulmonis TaxID=2951408 RepID=A0A9X2EF19_9NOCA|nr:MULTISPECIES: hypothetical protein [Nocardia]MCM6778260.1 hypothetical protein [Nocardia pulmonis]MCM6791149.1 hypothetical protein [Nocardia sp. CDC159]